MQPHKTWCQVHQVTGITHFGLTYIYAKHTSDLITFSSQNKLIIFLSNLYHFLVYFLTWKVVLFPKATKCSGHRRTHCQPQLARPVLESGKEPSWKLQCWYTTGWLGTLDPHQVSCQDVNPEACTLGWTCPRTLHCKKGNDRQTTILGAPLHSTWIFCLLLFISSLTTNW